MKIRFLSLSSGSSGNCYYLGTDTYGILIDAGIGVRTIKKFLKECYEIEVPNGFGNAIEYYTGFEKKKLLYENFIKIKNTPEFVPEKGDIFVWNEKRGKGAGHVAICTGIGDTKNFYSYDLNWNGSKKVKEVKHDYKNVLGVLRYKKKEEKKKVNYKMGDLVYVPVSFTGAKENGNVLVEYKKNQFWVLQKEFLQNQSVIIGTVCFIQENSYGLSFFYNFNGSQKEFQMNVPKEDVR